MKVKVRNMQSSRGNNVANQFVITADDGMFFQSYSTIIAFRPYSGKIQLDANAWDCSVTTSRYRNYFLGEKKAETQRSIDAGDYELVDLN